MATGASLVVSSMIGPDQATWNRLSLSTPKRLVSWLSSR